MVPLALFGWPFVVLGLFAVLPPRRAVIAAFLFAWLFLPMAGYMLSGLPNYTKVSATSVGVMLGIMIFDAGKIMKFRPSLVDIPMAVLTCVPMASSLTNGLGVNDGIHWMLEQMVDWTIPYFIGRLYFSDLEGLRELAIGIFIGGLIYVPFCLFENRMSPRLHQIVYGFHQHSFGQHRRFGGYRPKVFMQHGLAVAMWMSIASVVGIWLWRSGTIKRIWMMPMGALTSLLVMTTVLCRSLGALALFIVGTGALFMTKWTGQRVFLLALICAPLLYMGTRGTGAWDGSHLAELAGSVAEERVGSLQYRFRAEDLLTEHAWRQPAFGWGRFGRNRPYRMGYADEDLATDGLWVIYFGQQGLAGLGAVTLVILVPVLLLWRRLPAIHYSNPQLAPTAALAVVLTLFMCDSMLNAMLNPFYLLIAGGLGGWCITKIRRRRPTQIVTNGPYEMVRHMQS